MPLRSALASTTSSAILSTATSFLASFVLILGFLVLKIKKSLKKNFKKRTAGRGFATFGKSTRITHRCGVRVLVADRKPSHTDLRTEIIVKTNKNRMLCTRVGTGSEQSTRTIGQTHSEYGPSERRSLFVKMARAGGAGRRRFSKVRFHRSPAV